MFLGHYGAALAAKRIAPRASLGVLVFAAQFADLLWPVLLLAGIEHVRIAPGIMQANSLDFVHYPISHSLLALVGWAALIGGAYSIARRYVVGAATVGALVLSHWLLDAPMHRPDLPLWPGSMTMVGGGLWDSIVATLAIESALLALGLGLYLRSTRAMDRIGSWGLWAGIALLAVFWLGSFTGPPPGEDALAIGALSLWLFVPWAWWVDRHRAHNSPVEGET